MILKIAGFLYRFEQKQFHLRELMSNSLVALPSIIIKVNRLNWDKGLGQEGLGQEGLGQGESTLDAPQRSFPLSSSQNTINFCSFYSSLSLGSSLS